MKKQISTTIWTISELLIQEDIVGIGLIKYIQAPLNYHQQPYNYDPLTHEVLHPDYQHPTGYIEDSIWSFFRTLQWRLEQVRITDYNIPMINHINCRCVFPDNTSHNYEPLYDNNIFTDNVDMDAT